MTVAMDGPAGCGKSTIARMLSERAGFTCINSGSLYRAIAYAALGAGIGIDDSEALIRLARGLDLGVDEDGSVLLSGSKLGRELRSAEVDAVVAQVSAVPELRKIVNGIVRTAACGRDVVVEGRDMTTVVFPDAEVRFYIDASIEERARRRFAEGSSGLDYGLILENIRMRDEIDKGKRVGALKIAPGVLYLDTSGLTIERVYEIVYSQILHVREAHGE
ncbi:MAG TPA: (d)CMP kinase [Rectinemataceae bacterium]